MSPVPGKILRSVRASLSGRGRSASARAALQVLRAGPRRDPRLLAYALGYDVLCDPNATGGTVRRSDDPSFVGVLCYAWDPDPDVRRDSLLNALAQGLLGDQGARHVPALASALATMV